jgi:glycosyltransferase involved in cell wall biosynthesis
VLSEAFKSLLVRTYGVCAGRVCVVPGGVDVDRFDSPLSPADAREQLGWPPDRPILLAVRRLVRRVGLGPLVDAMQRVRVRVPDALLLIAGKGPLADELRARIRHHDLDDHVRLLGFVPDETLPAAYRAADLSVVPTRSLEGFGLVAAESLAAGTPALVTPVGGLPEVVRDLSPDLVTESASTAALRRRLVAALDGSLSLPSAAECRDFAAARYDWPVVAQRVRAVYEEVL